MEKIVIRGARVHNLKNIDVEIPRDQLVVITGLSGSGKSTLAFDTLYAEGQRRYVESLSAYARQFLEQMERPDVESIEGLSPAIAIDQRSMTRNPRSTVGTVTEIYDYLRLLFARVGEPFCPHCGSPISSQTLQQITETLLRLAQGNVPDPFLPHRPGEEGRIPKGIGDLRRDGFVRVRIDGQIRDLGEEIQLDKNKRHEIDVLVDRVVVKEGAERRITDSLEIASRLSEGIIKVEREGVSAHGLQPEVLLHRLRVQFSGDHPADVFLQQPPGGLPDLRRIGDETIFRSRPSSFRTPSLSLDRRRHPSMEEEGGVFLETHPGGIGQALSFRSRYALFDACPNRFSDLLLHGSEDEKISFRVKGKREVPSFPAEV